MAQDNINIAVVGVGSWGKNLVRNFATAPRCNLKYVCDINEKTLAAQKRLFPAISFTTSLDDVLNDGDIQAVVVATPAPSHAAVAKRCLEANKHTYVEKPLALSSAEAKELVDLAARKGLKLMVGHLLEYHPAVNFIKEMVDKGQIGQPYYMYTQRVNLGVVRRDENAWWSLAPHDISVICYLFGSEPVSVAAHGQCFLQKDIEDVVFATVKFADGKVANIHCSWLDPHKIRKMTVVGSEKMVSFDDMEATEKVRIYDKGASIRKDFTTSYAEIISLRYGDITIPQIAGGEPLAIECKHFIDCVLNGQQVRSDGLDGLRVVRILEAGQYSLKHNGQPVDPGEF
ncbi:MAG: Gfo/Idh/MocA family oxidoreductase [Sedimentisphaerales bacterium]|jgi:predicted dehydrogenase|nr:Gfo/Idh/MocA family oxidoreductase [Sedimentisphaerales bacterium]